MTVQVYMFMCLLTCVLGASQKFLTEFVLTAPTTTDVSAIQETVFTLLQQMQTGVTHKSNISVTMI